LEDSISLINNDTHIIIYIITLRDKASNVTFSPRWNVRRVVLPCIVIAHSQVSKRLNAIKTVTERHYYVHYYYLI